MSYTAILASKSEIMAFNKGVSADSFQLTSAEFDTYFDVLHAGLEAMIITYLNRIDLTASTLAGAAYTVMKNALKMATIMAFSNYFLWLKQVKEGRIVNINDNLAFIDETKVFTAQVYSLLDPYRIPGGGAVSPADTDADGDGEIDEIEYDWE